MQRKKRRKRPPVARTEPDRSFAGWVKPGPPREGPGAGRPAEPEPEESGPPNGRDRTYQAINGAYRLIDEYLRQGQKMAEELWLPAEASGRTQGAFDAPMRFMRAMGDMTMAWMEVMQQWPGGSAQPQGSGVAGPFTAGRPPPAPPAGPAERAASPSATRPLRVSVNATVPVEVSVHLADGTDLSDLVASELRTFGGDPASIRSVVVEATGPRGEPPVLRIAVPPGQAAGTYSGLLVSRASQQPRGTISLVVS
jgi:hypothetical protein